MVELDQHLVWCLGENVVDHVVLTALDVHLQHVDPVVSKLTSQRLEPTYRTCDRTVCVISAGDRSIVHALRALGRTKFLNAIVICEAQRDIHELRR